MSPDKGTLNVKLDFLSSELSVADWPIKVHRSDSTIVATTVSSQTIELAPGTYYVEAQMPAGQKFSAQTEVKAGRQTLEIKPISNNARAYGPQEAKIFLAGRALSFRPKSGWRYLLSLAHKGLGRMLGKTTSRSGRLRVVRGNLLADAMEVISTINFRPETLDLVVRLNVTIGGGAGFLQLVQPGVETMNVAFPYTAAGPCFVYVTKPQGSPYSIEVHLENSTADALLRYTANGMLEWATIATTATRLRSLREFQIDDPVCAVVKAYALLRLGEHDRLPDLLAYFGNIDWLPDCSVIRGEYYARTNRHAAALAEFTLLAERGLPFFTAGFKYALQALESYTSRENAPFTGKQKGDAEELLFRLEKLNRHIDFRQPFLTFTGINPLQPDDETFKEDMTNCPGYDLAGLEFRSGASIVPIELIEPSMPPLEEGKRESTQVDVRIRTVLFTFAVLFLLGMSYVGLSTFRALDGTHVGISIFWSAGIFMTGAVVGFLFGMPKVLQTSVSFDDPSLSSPTKDTSKGIPQKSRTKHFYRSTTNLEQVSDWLTKILIGVALIKLNRLPSMIDQASNYIATGLGGTEQKFLASAMLIFFPLIGFLSSYLITRFYLGRDYGLEHPRDFVALRTSQSSKAKQ